MCQRGKSEPGKQQLQEAHGAGSFLQEHEHPGKPGNQQGEPPGQLAGQQGRPEEEGRRRKEEREAPAPPKAEAQTYPHKEPAQKVKRQHPGDLLPKEDRTRKKANRGLVCPAEDEIPEVGRQEKRQRAQPEGNPLQHQTQKEKAKWEEPAHPY